MLLMLLDGSLRWTIKTIWDLWELVQQCEFNVSGSRRPTGASQCFSFPFVSSSSSSSVDARQNPRTDSRWRWRGSTQHTLTCLGDKRVQGLGLPEAVAITGSPVFQPIGLAGLGARGRGRAVARGGPIPLRCLLGPLSLETHSKGACQSVGDGTIWLQIRDAANI